MALYGDYAGGKTAYDCQISRQLSFLEIVQVALCEIIGRFSYIANYSKIMRIPPSQVDGVLEN